MRFVLLFLLVCGLGSPGYALTIDLPAELLTALREALGTTDAPASEAVATAFLTQRALDASRAKITETQRAQAQSISEKFLTGDATRRRAILDAAR